MSSADDKALRCLLRKGIDALPFFFLPLGMPVNEGGLLNKGDFMKKTIGSAALIAMTAISTAQAAPTKGAPQNRMPAALPAGLVQVGCKVANRDCVTAVRTYTEDGPDYSTITYSYCPAGATVVTEANLNFCALPKPMML